jgi:electron transfer flavoprotein-quinone oxidoreductase
MTEHQSMAVDYRTSTWGEAPYNGATALRPDFDAWLADQAVAAGATLVCSTTATGLIRDGSGRVIGVHTDRPDGDLTASVVIACDGVNSFLAKEAGLHPHADDTTHLTLGAKEVLSLPREAIEDRFGLSGDEGADFEIVGCTGDIAGGGFIYTNLDTISVGVVLRLSDLAASDVRPEELIAGLKSHPMVAPLVRGATLEEYSAHVIPEGGWNMMPTLGCDGMLVSGDAAAFCLAAGLWLEGVNFAIGGGAAAGAAAVAAIDSGSTGDRMVDDYRSRLEGSFVLADHKRLRRVPEMLLSEDVQFRYPRLICDLVESVYQVTNPVPKPGITRLLLRAKKEHGVTWRMLVRDAWKGYRSYG